MTDPYEILGVRRNASAASIKAAYRRQAKTLHPDVGGGRAEFDLLCEAYDCLRDPDRRAHFDATGQMKASQPDNALAQAHQVIIAIFDGVMMEIMAKGFDPEKEDMIANIRGGINKQRQVWRENIAEMQKQKPKMTALSKRFKTKKGPNLTADVLRSRILNIDTQCAQMEANIETAERALKILDDMTFDRLVPEPMRMMPIQYRVFNTTGSW